MKVFMTGATGYIGSAVAQRFQKAGHQVTGLARSESAAQALLAQGIEAVLGNLEDLPVLTGAAKSADAVIQAAFPQGGDDFSTATRIEREAVQTLLNALQDTGKTLLVTSGTAVLGDTGNRIFDEETPIILPEPAEGDATDNPLEALKERLAMERSVLENDAVRGIVLRPPNVYGHSDGHAVLALLRNAGRSLGAVPYAIGTGGHRWSFVHIDDLAELFLLALEHAPAGQLFHAGAQSGLKTRDIAVAVSRGIGFGGKTIELDIPELGQALGVPALAPYWASNSQSSSEKARQLLGWMPNHLNMLEEIAGRKPAG